MSRRAFGSDPYLQSAAYVRKLDRAAEMRQNMTPSEKAFWALRDGIGERMVRQKPLLGYIVDFYVPARRAIIEIDGRSHSTDRQLEWDAHRDDVFRDRRYSVLRVEAEAVLRYPDAIVDVVRDFLGELDAGYIIHVRHGFARLARRGVMASSGRFVEHRRVIDHYPNGEIDLVHQDRVCVDPECGGRPGEPSFWPLVVGS